MNVKARGKSKQPRKIDQLRFTPCDKAGKVAAAYIRVSEGSTVKGTDGKTERESIPQQREGLIDFCKSQGWDYRVYDEDVDISGYEDELRPDLHRLLSDIQAGQIHTIVCRELSRLARNEHLQSTIINEYCRPYGVSIAATMEHVDISSPDGRLMANIHGNRNESYLLYVAERSMGSKEGLVKKGQLRTTPPLGYGIQEIDGVRFPYKKEDEADIVRELFRRYTERAPREKDGKPETLMDIRDDFESRGLTTKRGGHWYLSNMNRLLRTRVFIGECTYNGEDYPSPYPAIIDRAVWDNAQDKLSENETGGKWKKSKHLLSGLLVCGHCEAQKAAGADIPYPITERYVHALGKTWHQVNGKNVRTTYGVYRCQTKLKHRAAACPDSPSVAAEDAEKFVREYIVRYTASGLADDRKGNGQANMLKDRIAEADVAIAKADRKIAEASKAYDADRISIEMVGRIETEQKTKKTRLDAQKADLNRKLEALQKNAAHKSLTALEKWDSLTTDQQREHLANVIDKVVVWPGKLLVHTTLNPGRCVTVNLHRARVAPEWWQAKGLGIKVSSDMAEQADLQTDEYFQHHEDESHEPPKPRKEGSR